MPGIAVYVKFVRADIKIIGVEPDDADCLNRALEANSCVIKVLMGVQMAQSEKQAFQQCLAELDFVYSEKTENPAYCLFSGGMK